MIHQNLKKTKKSKNLVKPREPTKPKEPKEPDFEQNQKAIDICNAAIQKLKIELKPMKAYLASRQHDLIDSLQLNRSIVSKKACGTKGCILTLHKDNNIKIEDNKKWKCDLIDEYKITITHHLFHSLSSEKFTDIVNDVSEKFGIFITKIGNYNSLDESFGHFGFIDVNIIGKEFVIPFIRTILNELEKGANLENIPMYQLPNTIISNNAISHLANKEYFIRLMRRNKIDVTLDGSIVKGSLEEKRKAFNLINQRRVELLFPFLSIKIPETVMIAKLEEKIQHANNIRPPNKKWVKIYRIRTCFSTRRF